MEKINLKPDFVDDRGAITDLIAGFSVSAITHITCNPGAVRGNHVHQRTTQWDYVIRGRVRRVVACPGGRKHEFVLVQGDLFRTDANEAHAIEALEYSELMIFTVGPRSGKDYDEDTFCLEVPLIPPGAKN